MKKLLLLLPLFILFQIASGQTVPTTTTWTGVSSTSWFAAGNWSNGVPGSNTNVIINSGPVFMPTLTNTAVTLGITLGQGAALTLNSGAQLFVNGSFVNNGGTFTHNAGDITFGATSGTQIIPALTYFNLKTSGAGSKVLGGNITVNGTLTIANGIINAPTNTQVNLNGTIVSEDLNSYVVGKLIKSETVPNASNSINLGNIGVIIQKGGGITGLGTVTVTRTTGVPVVNKNNNSQKSIKRQWKIDATGTPPGNNGADITFTWISSENNDLPFATKFAQVWRLDPLSLTWVKSGGPEPITISGNKYSVTAQSVKDFNQDFAITDDIITALPVTWLSFTGKETQKGIQLNWATASEKNSRSFVVERSVNGKDFQEVGSVPATGNSSTTQNYSFEDKILPSLLGKALYYRLNQIDLDNTQSYSKIIPINVQGLQKAQTVVAYPNPTSGTINFLLDKGNPESALVEVRNILGQLMGKTNVIGQKADLSIYPAGTYLISIQTENKRFVTRVVKN